ncbi:MAG: NADH-quinone oxidoreductase subunit E [Armatimonadota bacterium]
MFEKVLFFLLALIAISTAVGVVANRNPVRSALLLVMNFISLAILYFMLSAQFLGVLQVIVYAGAIMVLFLFVIMLLNLGSPEAIAQERELKRPLAWLVAMGLFSVLMSQALVLASYGTPQLAPDIGTARTIGLVLFTQWAFPLLLVALLLTVGVIGSILLARRRPA